MDYKEVITAGCDTHLLGVKNLSLSETLDCGQCFRWEPVGENSYSGIACGRRLVLTMQGDTLVLHNTSPEEFHEIWHDYFDFGADYTALKQRLSTDPALKKALEFCPGLRVLRQPPWETLCSFIISQNNNIPRIKGIVHRMCFYFGEELQDGDYGFPAPEVVAKLKPSDMEPVRAGFRSKYLLDAAKKVVSGEVDLGALYTLALDEARHQLQLIKGVGPKVADCTLLYGFARWECMPVDVWIGRALEEFYPDGFPGALADVAGIGQQYLFHYVRNRE